jgi:glycosyltransferase involved in cell wall biosynthesis
VKVAVYSIAKDEQPNVYGWAGSAADADHRFILDTGSKDSTRATAELCGAQVARATITPWRFDDARNAALAALPGEVDVCIALDLDERLMPGWRSALEASWAVNPDATRWRYDYVWSWTQHGDPDLVYGGDKIHARHGYRWKHPVHEVLVNTGIDEVQTWVGGLRIEHHPDMTKTRQQYLPLLVQACGEDPTDDRNSHYLAREYWVHHLFDEAKSEALRHLSLPRSVWPAERAASMRILAAVDYQQREQWLLKACAEAGTYRENWLALSRHYLECGMFTEALGAVERALRITDRQKEYLTQAEAWDGTLERVRDDLREQLGLDPIAV